MRLFYLFVFIIVSYSTALCTEFYSDFQGNKFSNLWSGETNHFAPNGSVLQLQAPSDGKRSALYTQCRIFDEATWELRFRMAFNPSGSNYLRFYMVSDSPDLKEDLNGYFVQVGNASDQIVLYRQSGTSIKKLASSEASRVNRDSLCITLKVQRAKGEWRVFAKINDEETFREECSARDTSFAACHYMGFVCKYTTTRNEAFYFDYVAAQGEEVLDETPPTIKKSVQTDSCLQVTFSERIKTKQAHFLLNQKAITGEWDASGTQLTFRLPAPLKHGNLYALELKGVEDMAGNQLQDTQLDILIEEGIKPMDLIINEVLFNPYEEGVDYVELYNRSDHHINLGNLLLATYKSDSIIYAAKNLPYKIIAPQGYAVITTDPEAVCRFYDCPDEEAFVTIAKLPSYGNTQGSVVLTTKEQLIIDDFRYKESMHNELLKEKEGVSLERISPYLEEWTSAAESAGFGTPGHENSTAPSEEEDISLSQKVCFPHLSPEGNIVLSYSLTHSGYMANVTVFSLNGIIVRHLAQNLLLSTHGEITWDGCNDSGSLLPIAPYILLFEAHDAEGDVIRKKFVGVVSQ